MSSLWDRVDASGDCWEWTGARNHNGYGSLGGALAHRLAYEELVGAVPNDLQLDHLCRNRVCVNPDHLEIVTSRENTLRGFGISARRARQTHCLNGHAFTPDNTIWRRNGRLRECKACALRRHTEYWARRKARLMGAAS